MLKISCDSFNVKELLQQSWEPPTVTKTSSLTGFIKQHLNNYKKHKCTSTMWGKKMNKLNKTFIRNKLSISIALLTGSLVMSPVVLAQEVAQTAEKSDELKIEVIKVTAQKRVQSMQDVPVTISTVGEEELANIGFNSIQDVATLVPAINVYGANTPAMASISIRGAGTGASDPTLQPSVGVMIDGVFMPRSVFGISDLVDVNRVEVLLGPQGTLYGKNTNSGVINVSTKGAPDEFELDAELSLGNYNSQVAKISLGYAINDDLSFRLGGISRTRDGFLDNIATGDTAGDIDKQALRGQLFWNINDDFTMRAIGYTSESTGGANASESNFSNGKMTGYLEAIGAPAEVIDIDPLNRKISLNEDRGTAINPNLKTTGGSVEFEYDFGQYTLTSITAFQDWSQNDFYGDVDGTALAFVDTIDDMAEESFSQELRITSVGDGDFEWIAGLFYFDSELTRGSESLSDIYTTYGIGLPGVPTAALSPALVFISETLIAPGDQFTWYNKHDTQSLAAFGQGTWYINDQTSLTFGLRYGEEEKDFRMSAQAYDGAGTAFNVGNFLAGAYQGGSFVPFISGSFTEFLPTFLAAVGGADPADLNMAAGAVNRDGNRKDDDVTGMISISHKIDYGMLFATISTGAKSGGFNGAFGAASIEDREFDQEKTINYEVGAKLDLLDGRMRLNTSYFHTVYTDFQAATFDAATVAFGVANAGKQTTQGVDVDLTYLISESLSVNAKVEYLDAIYNEFDGANCHGEAEDVIFNADKTCNISGHTLEFAPKWAGSISLDYYNELEIGEVYGSLNTSFKTSHLADPTRAPFAETDYAVFNARIGWRSDSWDISLWGKNLTDETYGRAYTGNLIANIVGDKTTDHRVFLNDPMTAGITVRYSFY